MRNRVTEQMMVQHRVHALAVVSAQDQLLGIIITTDIMHAAFGRSGRATRQRRPPVRFK
jgi:CBS domain-containing protein